jgi:nitroreductase
LQPDVQGDLQPFGDIHPLLAGRFSPEKFDRSGTVDEHAVSLLLEAARWAPSAGNSQPWGFFTTRPDDENYGRVVRHLARSSARWALDAGLLVVTLARRYVIDPEMIYSEFADYDLGQAVAHLTLQARAMGLATHQFRAFDLDGLTQELRPSAGWVIVSMIAVGKAAGDPPQRSRRSVVDLRSDPWSLSE